MITGAFGNMGKAIASALAPTTPLALITHVAAPAHGLPAEAKVSVLEHVQLADETRVRMAEAFGVALPDATRGIRRDQVERFQQTVARFHRACPMAGPQASVDDDAREVCIEGFCVFANWTHEVALEPNP